MRNVCTRRQFIRTLGGAASAFWLSPPNLCLGSNAPTAPVSVARCRTYGSDVLPMLETMFDQLGGLERLVRGKTVAVKLNLTGLATGRLGYKPPELTHWVHPQVIGATVHLLGKAGARRIRLLESPYSSELVDDLPWGETSLMRVGTSQVEVELVEGNLGQEVGTAREGFQIEELIFDEAVNGLDVGLVGVGARRDTLMLGAEVGDGGGEVRARAIGLQLADELAAVFGLPSQVAEGDAAALQMGLDALGEQGAGLGRALGGIGQELQAAADLAGGVLDGGQAACLHLRPIVRDIVEVLGVGGDLLEQGPGGFQLSQILFLWVLATAGTEQTVLAQDALDGPMAQGQFSSALQAPGAEGGQPTTQFDHLLGQLADDLVRAGAGGALT